ncbi:hypothetical protein [Coleofasciculus sp. FACHB-64]|uniref:coiled-coil domain-containing protein n=1 Tax=Cyanophyceae TaxID=3028117 RepID=UPI001A7F00F5|nr:hypothetical protein [Coleofasciculus sp. FACHB-64]
MFSEIDSYSKQVAKFLVKNADQKDFAATLDNQDQYEKGFSTSKQLLPLKPFSNWNRFGKIFLDAEGRFRLDGNKLKLTGNKASADATLKIRHDIVPSMPPHFSVHFHGEASDQNIFSNKSNEIGKVELTFEGLLLKGVPNYLRNSNVAQREFEKYGIKLEADSDPNKITDKATLKRTLSASGLSAIDLYTASNELKNVETRLDANKKQILELRSTIANLNARIEQARQGTNPDNIGELEKRLGEYQAQLKKLQVNPLSSVVDAVVGGNNVSEATSNLKKEIAALEEQIRQARVTYNEALIPILQNNLKGVQDRLQAEQDSLQKNIASKYQTLASIPLTTEFTCGPEFVRKVEFPIVERKVSVSGQGSSAKAGVGVSGDVVIDISKPTCKATLVPPFKLQSSIYSDVSITSSSYIGAQANAQAEIGVNFQDSANARNKYGDFQIKLYKVALEESEKQAITEFVYKTIEDAKKDQKVVESLAKKIEVEMLPSIVNPAIDGLVDSINVDTCSLLGGQIKDFNRQAKGDIKTLWDVCRVGKLTKIPKPTTTLNFVTAREEELRGKRRQLGELEEKLLGKLTRFVNSVDVLCNPKTPKPRALKDSCQRRRDLNTNIERLARELSPFNTPEKLADLERKWKDYNIQQTYIFEKNAKDKFRNLIRDIASNHIFRKLGDINSKSIAKAMLERAWEFEETGGKVNEWVDLGNEILQMGNLIPERLSIGVSASARAALSTTATFLTTRPEIANTSELKFNNAEKPFLSTEFSAYQNGPDAKEGVIGGFNPLGIKFTIKQIVCVGGKVSGSDCSSPKAKKIPKDFGRDKPWYIESTPEAFEKLAPGTKM